MIDLLTSHPPYRLAAAGIVVALYIGFALRTVWIALKTGRSPVTFGNSDSAHDYMGRLYRLCGLGVFVTFAIIFSRVGEGWIFFSVWEVSPVIGWLGVQLAAIGALIILVAQFQMGASWRIGIDEEQAPLVTSGLFGLSRNPVYLGMRISWVGVCLAIPSAPLLMLASVLWVSLGATIRMEEEFMGFELGDAYKDYCAKVRRWV